MRNDPIVWRDEPDSAVHIVATASAGTCLALVFKDCSWGDIQSGNWPSQLNGGKADSIEDAKIAAELAIRES